MIRNWYYCASLVWWASILFMFVEVVLSREQLMANITIKLLLAGVWDTVSHQMFLSTECLDFQKSYYWNARLMIAIIVVKTWTITLLQFGSSHLNGRRPKCNFTCCAKCSLRLNTYGKEIWCEILMRVMGTKIPYLIADFTGRYIGFASCARARICIGRRDCRCVWIGPFHFHNGYFVIWLGCGGYRFERCSSYSSSGLSGIRAGG